MNMAIVTCYTSNIADLVAPLSKNKQEYCDKWGYRFFLDIVNNSMDEWEKQNHRVFGFYRIVYLLQLMNINPLIDVFYWMDNDAFIMNQTISLDTFIKDLSNCDFLIGEDWNGINDGGFFIKNTEKCKNFLQNILNFIPSSIDFRPYWWVRTEQCAITSLLHTVNTYIAHHSIFNGYIIGPRPDNDWRPLGLGPFDKNWAEKRFQLGDFAIHLAGISNEQKPALIQKYLKEVIK